MPATSFVREAPRPAAKPHLIGVFDSTTGQVIEGAEVVDVVNGTFMRTSATGTATLAFLSAGAKEIRIQKPGYETLTMAVPADTASLTVVLTPQPAKPPRHTQ